MNKIVVSGNLAKDIEVRIVNVGDNNFPVASICVANEVGYGDKKVDGVERERWGEGPKEGEGEKKSSKYSKYSKSKK